MKKSVYTFCFRPKYLVNMTRQLLLVLALAFSIAFATRGVDVSQPTSTAAFHCMVQNGYSFAIVRVFQSNGVVDPHGAQSIANAWAGGMSHVDGYMYTLYTYMIIIIYSFPLSNNK
jgi:hypothetical protein